MQSIFRPRVLRYFSHLLRLLNVSPGESNLKRAEEEAKIQVMPVAGTSRYLATLFLASKTSFFVCKYVICPIIQDPTDIQRMY